MTSHVAATIRYDGPALTGGEMDVQDLAPALLALAEIAKIANQKFNGDRANIRVMVNADIENKCFEIDLSLVQSWIDQAKVLIGSENLVTVNEIGNILGWTSAAFGTAGGVFGFYRWLAGKKAMGDQLSLTANDARGTVVVQIIGDGNSIEVDQRTVVLAQDRRF